MARGDRQWHVPSNCWKATGPGGAGTPSNVGFDIFTVLVGTDVGGTASVVPGAADEYVCERIIGQYMLVSSQLTPEDFFVHHRVYPTISDAASVALRDLTSDDDAESDFLWHSIEAWRASYNNDSFGNWGPEPADDRYFMGRSGHIDIRVNRRIRQGEALVWHTQLVGAAAPMDDSFFLKLWLRMLVKEG